MHRWSIQAGCMARTTAVFVDTCAGYLAPSSPERIREVYGVNYSRLARIKAQYDPEYLFRSNHNVLPSRGG